eukprot:scaffold1068_cov375-Prasinococcus_capsulatus_cf.AAC.15
MPTARTCRRFFDVDKIADTSVSLPHMLPSETLFQESVRALGVNQDDLVVVYDGLGLFSAARAWWMFRYRRTPAVRAAVLSHSSMSACHGDAVVLSGLRFAACCRVFGHDKVVVLEGGLPGWKQVNGSSVETEPETAAAEPGDLEAHLRPALLKGLAEVHANIESQEFLLVDARSEGRFKGTAPEPRPGLRGGHVPGSANIPFSAVLTSDGFLKPDEELAAVVRGAGLGDKSKPVVASCGTGVTACIVALALFKLGLADVAVYDGSWTEWALNEDMPVEGDA